MFQEWSPLKRILSACEKIYKKPDKNLVTLVSSFENMELFLEYAFVILPGVADRSLLQIIHYTWLSFIRRYGKTCSCQMEPTMACFPRVARPCNCTHTLLVTLFNPQSIQLAAEYVVVLIQQLHSPRPHHLYNSKRSASQSYSETVSRQTVT